MSKAQLRDVGGGVQDKKEAGNPRGILQIFELRWRKANAASGVGALPGDARTVGVLARVARSALECARASEAEFPR